ncbi:MAG: tryptophan--tRNA ligase, partial [Desulfitobacterium sp.]|nr:tryptophan--tRNA ligase [Desulfitobacterium sp.]
MKGRIFSGMRPTGALHIGHLSVLQNWVALQDDYESYYSIVDLHALTTGYEDKLDFDELIRDIALDWLSVGLDPKKSTIFVQSHIKEHSELHLLLSMITPLSWLERVPTYKDQLQQLGKEGGKNIATYGFLGYPLLQAADILVYKADSVPVGEDQIPHIELSREIA